MCAEERTTGATSCLDILECSYISPSLSLKISNFCCCSPSPSKSGLATTATVHTTIFRIAIGILFCSFGSVTAIILLSSNLQERDVFWACSLEVLNTKWEIWHGWLETRQWHQFGQTVLRTGTPSPPLFFTNLNQFDLFTFFSWRWSPICNILSW